MEPLTSNFWLTEAALLYTVVFDIVDDAARAGVLNAASQLIQMLLGVQEIEVDYGLLNERLVPLREAGVRIAVDDAGAGYASMRHVLAIHPDIIKLDLSLTRGIDSDSPRRALAAALIEFARQTQSHVVAEGVETASELAALVERVAPRHKSDKIHPATRIFQALRIAVNDELGTLERTLPIAIDLLRPGGRLAVISFHSLEDRIVKQAFKLVSTDCICPPEVPVCVCDHHATVRLVNRKPIEADAAEIERNPTVKAESLAAAARQGRPMSGLLFTYPVHQAADILFCHGNLVPGGQDQLPHVEITRTVARRFNQRYAAARPYFPEPDVLLAPAPTVLGTDGRKMSKSAGNALELRDDEDATARFVRRHRTDSERHITYEPDRRPDVANLLTLGAFAAATFASRVTVKPRPRFGHGAEWPLEGGRTLLCSYHPSQRNTFTGLLTEPMFDAVFTRALELANA